MDDLVIQNGLLKKYRGTAAEVDIPRGVTAVWHEAFMGSGVKKVTLAPGVFSIGDSAFAGCAELETVILPESLVSIGESAFEGCKKLRSISVPQSVAIGFGAFHGCELLADGDGFVIFNSQLFDYFGPLEEVTVPEGVRVVGSSAFSGNRRLTSLVLFEGVTELGSGALRACTSLASVSLPSSLKRIGSGAFQECAALEQIWLPSGVETIEYGTFTNCISLRSVRLPSMLKHVEARAFSFCRSIKHFELPPTLLEAGNLAFAYCIELESVTVPGRTGFHVDTFNGCTKLVCITAPHIDPFYFVVPDIAICAFTGYLESPDKADGRIRDNCHYRLFTMFEQISRHLVEHDRAAALINLVDVVFKEAGPREFDELLERAVKAGAPNCVAALLEWKHKNSPDGAEPFEL